MKKKSAILSLAVIAILMLSITGTLAYIALNTKDLVNEFVLVEIPNEIISSSDTELSNVTIKNTSTDKDAYIRATVVASWAETDEDGNITDAVWGIAPEEGVDYTINWETTGWKEYPSDSGIRYYTSKVSAGAETSILFTDCIEIDSGNKPDGYELTIEILAQSIQADGVDSDSNKPIELTWGVDIVDNDVVAATIN